MSIRRSSLILLGALLGGIGARPGAAQTPAISFAPPITYERPVGVPLLGVSGTPLIVADWDRDGALDLAVITQEGVSLLYGNGAGEFYPPVDYALGPRLQEGIAADVNGDGRPDLVLCHAGLGKVLMLLNEGGRRFSAPVNYPVGTLPVSVAAADFNGDGAVDLAVSNHESRDLSVLLNRGDGSFAPAVSYGGIDHPGGVITADFNRDGKADLAQTSLTENVVRILLGDGKGKFTVSGRFPTDEDYANRVVADDLNGDGILDLAVASLGNYSILFGDGTGQFSRPIRYEGYHLIDVGDLDGDGDPDLVTPGGSTSGFFVHRNQEGGNFLPPMPVPGPGEKTGGIRIADFNHDERPDMVAWNEGSPHLALYLNNTPRPPTALRLVSVEPSVIFKGCDLPQAGVLLTQSPQAEGAWISVRSTNPAVKVPEKVFVPQGATSAAIPFLEIAAVTSPVTGALTASYGGSVRQAPITVRPGGGDLRMKLTPNPVIGGQPVTVELDLPCPGRPLHNVVSMAASPPNAVEFPAFAVVPPDDTHLSFEIKTRPVAGAIRVQITVVTPAGARIETLQIQPAPPPPPPPTPPPVVNLLVNGSFEQPDTSSSPAGWLWFGPAGLPGRPPAAASIPGWKITQGTIDVKAWYWTAKDGKQSLDLVGDNPGAIEQSFATTPGQEYAFSGWIARNPANFYLPEGRGNVFLNGVLFLQLVHRDGSANLTTMHWQPFSARFRATTTLTTLTIVDATGTPFPGGLVLDGLVVNPVGASVSPPPAATKAPAAPSELAATAIAAHQVELRWRDNSSDETGFGVWRREGSSNWVRIGVAAPNVPRFTDRDVKPTRLYIYRVRAHNHDGASAWSDEISVSTPGQ